MEYVIGCDLGSQSLKVILLSAAGRICAEASANYPILYPRPAWADQSAQGWLDAFIQAAGRLVRTAGVPSAAIRGIALDAQVDGVVAVDGAGQPLRPAIIWMDHRAVAQCQRAGAKKDPAALFRLSGLNLDASHVAPKIRWLMDEEPEVASQARYYLLPGSYLAYALTGELAVDYSNASSSLLLDVNRREWSQELCDLFGIDPRTLPPVLPATQVIGTLKPEIATQIGLDPSTRVVLGSGDEHAACLGAGVTQPGLVCDIAGTAEPVCLAASAPSFDPSGLVETHCHADPDLWLLENPGFVSGANYRWFRDEFAASELAAAQAGGESAYEALNKLAEAVPPGSEGLIFLPCLMGAMAPTWNASARGTYFGFTLAHTRGHFVRALLEGSAYAMRDITDQMARIGLAPREIRVVGGGARSRMWRQIKADVSGLPVALPQTIETTALGAGMLALVGLGMCPSLNEAAARTVRIVEVLEPDPGARARYEDIYQVYRATYQALLPVFDQLAVVEGRHTA